MNIEIKGTVVQVLPSTDKIGGFVVTTEGEYPKTIAVKCWLDKVQPPAVESVVTVSANLSSREYNGKWYTDVTAYKLQVNAVGQALPF